MKSKDEVFRLGGIGELKDMEYEAHIATVMDEYAKEVAIDFTNWLISKKGSVPRKIDEVQYWYFIDNNDEILKGTTEDLFNLYKKETNK